MIEEWRDIKGYEGLYKISNLGNVYSCRGDLVMKSHTTNSGYKDVQLSQQGKRRYCLVHRLVAQAFIPNPENKLYVNHIDGDKTNNTVSNLEWVTQSENVRHAYNTGLLKHVGLKGVDAPRAKLSKREVLEIYDLARYRIFPYRKIGELYSIDHTVVSDIKNKKLWRHILP